MGEETTTLSPATLQPATFKREQAVRKKGRMSLGKLGCKSAGAQLGWMPGLMDAVGCALTFVRLEKFALKK